MYAVIKTGGKQYRVAPEDIISIEKVAGDVGDTVEFGEVLMLGGGDGGPEIGTPLLDGVSVAAKVVEQGRGPKIIVFKKKRRQNYRRKKGHRQELTTVRITDILTGGKGPAKPAKAAAKAEPAEQPKPAAKASVGDEAPAAMFERPAGEPDDLTKIKGVGPVIVKKLHALGVTKFAQIAAFTPEEVTEVDEELNFKGRIERDGWLEQAKELANSGE